MDFTSKIKGLVGNEYVDLGNSLKNIEFIESLTDTGSLLFPGGDDWLPVFVGFIDHKEYQYRICKMADSRFPIRRILAVIRFSVEGVGQEYEVGDPGNGAMIFLEVRPSWGTSR